MFFVEMSKVDVVREGFCFGVFYERIYICYEGICLVCGRCDVCTEWIEVFRVNGIVDFIFYVIDIFWFSSI